MPTLSAIDASAAASTGTWTVIFDGAAPGTQWGKINWTDLIPAGSSVLVRARSADNQADLPAQAYLPVSKGVQFALAGRFIQIESRLNASDTNVSPVLFDLTVNSLVSVCDVNGDGSVDTLDLNLIRAAVGQVPAANDPRDANGKITINDARACTLQCTRPGCTTN